MTIDVVFDGWNHLIKMLVVAAVMNIPAAEMPDQSFGIGNHEFLKMRF